MKIGFDAKRYFHNNTGLGNYSRTTVAKLQALFPDNEYVLYDEKTFSRTFLLNGKAAKDGCDVFHGLSNELPVQLPFKEKTAMKTVVTIHDVCWRTFPEMYHFTDRHLYDMKYGSSCRRADRILAISESTKRDVMEIYGVPEDKINVIYQPVQDCYYTPLTAESADALVKKALPSLPDDFILYVGSINKRKNLLAVVKALGMIPEENRPFLLVVGNGHEYRAEVEEYIAEHRLSGFIDIQANLHDSQILQALYAKALAFVYPSFYEGFGLPVVEAALQHTPVVTSTLSSLPEAAGPDACLVNPHDIDAPEQIAECIGKIISDADFAESTAAKMEAYARRMFNPETYARAVMNLYLSLL